MDLDQLAQAIRQPPQSLGVMPEFAALRPQFQIHWVEQTDSTNRDLAEQMAAGAAAGTVLIAATQRSGRGQWGRQWQSPLGGLYLSLGLQPDLAVDRSPLITLASAWGVATSLGHLGQPVQVKWPNDLVVYGKKLGGILVETRLVQGHIPIAIVGVGLNCFNPVPPTGISLQQLIQPEPATSPLNTLEGIAAVVLYGLIQGYSFWQSRGDEAFLAAYHTKMAHRGQAVMVNQQPVTVVGIAASGNLRVRRPVPSPDGTVDWELRPGEVTLGYNA